MEDVSNKTLAVLVSLAIIVSIAGLVLTLGMKNQRIPGAAVTNVSSGSGTTSFSVGSFLILTLSDNTVNLGSFGIGESASSDSASDFFTARNDGTINFDVYAYGASNSDSPFITSTGGANLLPNEYYKVYGKDSVSGTANTTYRNVPAAVGNRTLLVKNVGYTNGADTARLGVNVTIPADEPAGSKSATLIVYVEAS